MIGVTNKTVINRCAKLANNGFLIPIIVKTRICSYRLSDFSRHLGDFWHKFQQGFTRTDFYPDIQKIDFPSDKNSLHFPLSLRLHLFGEHSLEKDWYKKEKERMKQIRDSLLLSVLDLGVEK